MNYYIVKQRERIDYLRAPDDDIFHHKNVQKVKKGDKIFIHFKKCIVAISTALNDAKKDMENKYVVDLEVIDLKNEIETKLYEEKIESFRKKQGEHFPFNKNGHFNQGYLYKLEPEFARYLLSIMKLELNEENKLLELESIEKNIEKIPEGKERETIIKTRVNQSIFKEQLLNKEKKCKLCGLSNTELLIASHIKPWSKSNNKEKLCVNNGFLLCPNHDKLFDKCLISFTEDGEIMIAEELSEEDRIFLNINKNMKIKLNDENKKYIEWHRKKFLEENKKSY